MVRLLEEKWWRIDGSVWGLVVSVVSVGRWELWTSRLEGGGVGKEVVVDIRVVGEKVVWCVGLLEPRKEK
jgi:hypothetical protein